jgi:hypothetical protein
MFEALQQKDVTGRAGFGRSMFPHIKLRNGMFDNKTIRSCPRYTSPRLIFPITPRLAGTGHRQKDLSRNTVDALFRWCETDPRTDLSGQGSICSKTIMPHALAIRQTAARDCAGQTPTWPELLTATPKYPIDFLESWRSSQCERVQKSRFSRCVE